MKKIIRSFQTYFPYLHDFRFNVQLFLRRLLKKVHEEDFEALQLMNPPAGALFLDIGTNRGEAIQSMLIKGPENIRIIGFEPNPLVYKKSDNFFGRNPKVQLFNFALGDAEAELEFYIPFYRDWMFDGLASFKYEEAAEWLKSRLWNYKEQHLSIKKINAKVKKLDDLNLAPYFIKIDVQGFEYQVLKGGSSTIAQHEPILLIESITDQIKQLLSEYKYDFYTYRNGEMVPGTGKLNTFCITRKAFTTIASRKSG